MSWDQSCSDWDNLFIEEELQSAKDFFKLFEEKKKKLTAKIVKFMDENPMMYQTAQSIPYMTEKGKQEILTMTDDELNDYFREAYPVRPRTKREQEEAVAYMCRTFPTIPFSIIMQLLKFRNYEIVPTYKILNIWLKGGYPNEFQRKCPKLWPQDEVQPDDQERLPELEYYQVDLSRRLQLEVQKLFLLRNMKKIDDPSILEHKKDSDESEDETGGNETSDNEASDSKAGGNETSDSEAGENDKPLPN